MPVQPAGLLSLPCGVARAGRGGSCELMIGCVGKADAEAIAMDESEMEDVRWVSREHLRTAVARSAATDLSANGGGAPLIKIYNKLIFVHMPLNQQEHIADHRGVPAAMQRRRLEGQTDGLHKMVLRRMEQ